MGKGADYTAYPMTDAISRSVYLLLLLCFLVSVATVYSLGFKIPLALLSLFWTWPFLAVAGMLAQRIGKFRLASMMQGCALIYGQGLCLLMILFGMAAISGPYADHMLAAMDESLGFHWPDYVAATLPYRKPLTLAYRSFVWQPLLVVIALVLAGQARRMWTLLSAAIFASILTSIIFALFPARGVYLHYGMSLDRVVKIGTFNFHHGLDYLRGGGREISRSLMTGLVSFPSYHMAEVVLFTWAGWSVKWLRWPLLALNLVVVASIPVIGAHYFIDVLGGAVVAIVAIVGASYWIQLNSERTARGVEPGPSGEVPAVTGQGAVTE
jgi:membrane-associated phospholipid phosphatase